jgi:hypothetical protein
MPRPHRKPKARFDRLTLEQHCSLLVVDVADAFESDADRRQAWEIHRDRLMAEQREGGIGHRPTAYFDYDLGVPEPEDEGERLRLLDKAGELAAGEASDCTR